MPTQPIRMNASAAKAEVLLDAECLVLEISGETWYVPFDTLEWIPRIGETIQVPGGNRGTVTQVEYEFTSERPPVRVGEEMPTERLYARPARVAVKAA
jgi:hypothetical protein